MSAHCTAEPEPDWATDLACQIIEDCCFTDAPFSLKQKVVSARLRQLRLEGQVEGHKQALDVMDPK